jgi:iron only hydrogenase large subunit-like protein
MGCAVNSNKSSTEEEEEEASLSTLVLHFAIVHGMQTLQRALKDLDDARSSSSSSVVQYVEAMACPFGCVNGGGIVRSSTTARETPTKTRRRVLTTVAQLSVPSMETQEDEKPQLLHTRYHVVPPMQHTMGAAAGVKGPGHAMVNCLQILERASDGAYSPPIPARSD